MKKRANDALSGATLDQGRCWIGGDCYHGLGATAIIVGGDQGRLLSSSGEFVQYQTHRQGRRWTG
eukprot:1798273-Rhodomonas_salina.1